MKLWLFLFDRAAEAQTLAEQDSLLSVLGIHAPHSEQEPWCVGCGFSTVLANGYRVPRTLSVDNCPTLRALAWRWCDHVAWSRTWSMPVESGMRTWPPSENCYCGGPEEIYAHRRGTRRHCRLTKAARRWEARQGAMS